MNTFIVCTLLSASHIDSFNSQKYPKAVCTIIITIYKEGDWGTEGLTDMRKVTP